ncbi:MAG: hypothetical protein D6766_06070 [Verrucomicrobia bacterium]|nr:MAG: hypothetical protein D6766_06070 [Verrucomicrobiota bacterium]
MVRAVEEADPSFKKNTIHGTVWNLDKRFPKDVYKPSRGLFRLTKFRDQATDEVKTGLISTPPATVKEEDFYKPFADWLRNDVEDVTKAIVVGGNRFRDKWGTPDVIGKRESKRSDIIKAPVEIVSAEIKLETSQLVTAFGQACAYCLFSHKAYLVVPKQSPPEEIARLDSLCQVFGIGLVLFNASDPKDPKFDIRVRARKQDPDLFYANKYMAHIETELFS